MESRQELPDIQFHLPDGSVTAQSFSKPVVILGRAPENDLVDGHRGGAEYHHEIDADFIECRHF